MESEGFTVLMEDEAFFIHDAAASHKYWSPVGSPVTVPYTGSHRKIAVYGSVARDGKQFFRTYARFDSETFAKYLKDLQGHFGRVAVITESLTSPGEAGSGTVEEKQGHQNQTLPQGIAVPQRGGGMLASGKAHSSCLGIL